MTSSRLVDTVLFVVAIAWGSTYLATKELLPGPEFAPVVLAVRMVSAAALMFGAIALLRRLPRRAEVRTGLITGVVLAGVFACETYGVALTTATNAGVLISLTMILTPLLGAAVERQRPSRSFLGLALVAVLGDVLLATNGSSFHLRTGDLLILVAAALRAVHVTLLGRFQAETSLDTRSLTAVQMSVVAAAFALLSSTNPGVATRFIGAIDVRAIVLLGYLAAVCTVFAFFAQTWAIRHRSPAHVALLLGTEPVWAAVIGVCLAHDHLGNVALFGVVLSLTAIFAARRVGATDGDHRQDPHRRNAADAPAVSPLGTA